jgi:hypothetical protein
LSQITLGLLPLEQVLGPQVLVLLFTEKESLNAAINDGGVDWPILSGGSRVGSTIVFPVKQPGSRTVTITQNVFAGKG